MKELEYPKNMKLENFDIEVRPYLYLSEKRQIVEQMLAITNPFDRELCMWSIIFSVCCGIDEGADYDLLCATGLKGAVGDILWRDINEINNIVGEYESTPRLVTAFLNDMSNLADKAVKKVPTGARLDKIVDKFTKVIGEQNGGNNE